MLTEVKVVCSADVNNVQDNTVITEIRKNKYRYPIHPQFLQVPTIHNEFTARIS